MWVLHLPGLKILLRRPSLKTKQNPYTFPVKFLKLVLIAKFSSILEKKSIRLIRVDWNISVCVGKKGLELDAEVVAVS